MKTFIASIITFFVILTSVVLYVFYLRSSTIDFTHFTDEIVSTAKAENWEICNKKYDDFNKKWQKERKWYEAFVSHHDTEYITDLVLELKYQIEFKNKKQVMIYGAKLKEVYGRIYDDEIPTFENIV